MADTIYCLDTFSVMSLTYKVEVKVKTIPTKPVYFSEALMRRRLRDAVKRTVMGRRKKLKVVINEVKDGEVTTDGQ